MLKHYALVLFRNLSRESGYAALNVAGLALALACCLVLGLYLRSELSYDRHFEDHERIYRIVSEFTINGRPLYSAATSPVLAPLFSRSYPQAGNVVRFQGTGRSVFRSELAALPWEEIAYADPNVFSVFSHTPIFGRLEGALDDPASMVVSESFARQHFGNANPVGETVTRDGFDHRVTAVFADLPDNTHYRYDVLLSGKRLAALGRGDDDLDPERLHSVNSLTYIKTPQGMTGGELRTLLNDFYQKTGAPTVKGENISLRYEIQPLASVHFTTGWLDERPAGNIFYVYGFAAVAVFILLVACINYTNLAVARATKRAREVGMRKVIGASRWQLLGQFVGESLFYTLAALVLAVIIVESLETFTKLPQLLGKSELLDFAAEPVILLWVLLFAVVVALAASAYPALYLAGISPLAALTSVRRGRSQRVPVAKVLLFLQFFVSIAVLACTLLMALQMNYLSSRPLGFDKDAGVSVRLRGLDLVQQIPVIRNELLSDSAVRGVSQSRFVPGGGDISIRSLKVESESGEMETSTLWDIQVDEYFVEVMGLEIASGRNFSAERQTDAARAAIVNETLVRKMGWLDPIGKQLRSDDENQWRVIGVVRDFHFTSLHQAMEPMIIRTPQPTDYSEMTAARHSSVTRTLLVRLAPGQIRKGLDHLEAVIARFDPDNPFEYRFFTDSLQDMYESEANLMKLTGIFAGVCIFISCLGLFGLSAFTTEQRSKEIGVRKVLGASTGQIVFMLARGQMLLVAVAAVLASAVSWWVIDDWLTAFSYRTTIAWWVFVVATLVVGLVAFATVALQSSRTAQANPIKALRFE
jgi:putative ABC transport system permease protein